MTSKIAAGRVLRGVLAGCLCGWLLFALAFAAAAASNAFVPVEETTRITAYALTRSSGQGAESLRDDNYNTFVTLAEGETVGIAAETPATYIYLVWDTPPGPYQLLGADGRVVADGGHHGFLHELLTLAAGEAELTIQPNQAATLCDVYLFGEGELPSWVQRWQLPLEEADLLVLPTHADDEHLFFGGILPTYAGQRGLKVQVAYLTNHWGERYRPHELLCGLWTVGVTAYPVIGPFPDVYASLESLAAAEQAFGRENVLAFQEDLLRRFKPKVVVGHDLTGEYGHGAHILNAETLLEAVASSGEVQKAYLHLYAENEIIMDWNQPLPAFDGQTAFEMAVAGYACHRSQQEYFQVRQDGTWQDCRKFGLVYSRVGPDVAGGDLFENVVFEAEPEPTPQPTPLPQPSSVAPSQPAAPIAEPVASVPAAANEPPPFLPILALLAVAGLLVAIILLALRRKKH